MQARQATIAVTFALVVVPVIAMIGMATDGARAYMVKARLSQAADAAALAGGKAINSSSRDADIQKFFDGNFPTQFMDASVSPLAIDVNTTSGTVEVVAYADVPTTFLQILNVQDITVSARAKVKKATTGMELVLVMDNTGSMRSGGKIGAMKLAATDLVNILYGADETIDNFWVGLVPYSATVNIGNQRSAWLRPYDAATNPSGYDASFYSPTTWKGCVEARPAPHDSTDALPTVLGWNPHFWASTLNQYPGETGDNDWPGIDESNGAKNNGTGPNLGCGPAITPLTQSKTAVLTAISEMLPWHRGGTMANLGLAWGWRTLSPAWRGLWGGATPATLPLDYDAPGMEKVVILLTDGVNQWYDWPGGLPGKPNSSAFPDADYTAYGRLSEGRLGTTSGSAATTEVNNRMLTLCEGMKAQGITIYTIVFQLNNEATENLFRSCATTEDKFFRSPTNDDLVAAFHKIATQLSHLHLSE